MMDRIKLLVPLFLLFLVALSVTGCDSAPWESGMVLSVKVDTPKDGTTVTASPVTVSGRVIGTERKSAKVKVNDADVPLNEGKFSTSVTLKEGKNAIQIIGSAGGASPSETVNVTYAPAK